MKKLTLTSYSDPGHGWLKVKKSTVHSLGVIPTPYSYQYGEFYFLEEDCDASKFIVAATSAGYAIAYRGKWTNKRSKIRNYERAQ